MTGQQTDSDAVYSLARVLRHAFNPWSGRCGCGAGPFTVREHREHVIRPEGNQS